MVDDVISLFCEENLAEMEEEGAEAETSESTSEEVEADTAVSTAETSADEAA